MTMIDCEAPPRIPRGFTLERHRESAPLKWQPGCATVWKSALQADGRPDDGARIERQLEDESVLNANVLDWLFANQYAIPEEWTDRYLFFWGTIFKHAAGSRYVHCLFKKDDRWCWGRFWIGAGWLPNYETLLRS